MGREGVEGESVEREDEMTPTDAEEMTLLEGVAVLK